MQITLWEQSQAGRCGAAPAKTRTRPLPEAPAPIPLLEHLGATNEFTWEGKAE